VTPRVLVVDDDDVGRMTLSEILHLEGFEVDEAEGGRAALERLGVGAYDVMLLDLKMPDLDGVAVLQQAAELAPETEVIVFTAHGSMESAIQAVRHGAYDYLLKPTCTQIILESVRRAVERKEEKSRAQTGMAPATLDAEGLGPISWRHRLRWDALRHVDGVGREGRTGIELTPAETRLLLALHQRRGHVVTCEELVREVQGYPVESWEAPAMIRPVISRLRLKVKQAGGDPDRIGTVRGSGYLLEAVRDFQESSGA
jgi:DNA-binding response OmpR family regulator